MYTNFYLKNLGAIASFQFNDSKFFGIPLYTHYWYLLVKTRSFYDQVVSPPEGPWFFLQKMISSPFPLGGIQSSYFTPDPRWADQKTGIDIWYRFGVGGVTGNSALWTPLWVGSTPPFHLGERPHIVHGGMPLCRQPMIGMTNFPRPPPLKK